MIAGVNGMAKVQLETEIDWMACELIESVPGKVSLGLLKKFLGGGGGAKE
jgi:hypothetical protein